MPSSASDAPVAAGRVSALASTASRITVGRRVTRRPAPHGIAEFAVFVTQSNGHRSILGQVEQV